MTDAGGRTGTTALPKGAGLFADFAAAGRDPARFPEPTEIRLDRPEGAYIHHGWGPHQCLGRAIVTAAGAAMLRAFARSCGPGLRRAPGPAGEIRTRTFGGGVFPVFLAEDGGSWGPFPVSKRVLFDVCGEDGAEGRSDGLGRAGIEGDES